MRLIPVLAKPISPRVGAALAFVVVLFGAWFVITARSQHDNQLERQSVTGVAQTEAAAFALRIDSASSATYALAALLRQGNYQVDAEAFAAFAGELVRVQPAISTMQYAPGGVIRHVAPLARNSAALGLNLLKHPQRGAAARKAIASRALYLDGPFDLVQGGSGMVARLPVFRPVEGEEQFWGFTQVLIHLPALLAASGLEQLGERGLRWRLTRVAVEGGEQLIAGGDVGADAVAAALPVPGGKWRLDISPIAGWYAGAPTVRRLEWLLGFVLAGFMAYLAHALLRQPVLLSQQVAERTKALAAANEQRDLAIEAADVGLWDWQVSSDKIAFNDRWRLIVGAPNQEAMPGSRLAWWESVHPADIEAVKAAAVRQLKGENDFFEVEFRMRRWDGEWIWAKGRGRVVERDANGRALRAAGTLRDTSTAHAVFEQLSLKSTALEVAANAIVITDVDGNIEWVNPAFTSFTGYAADEVIGRTPSFLKSGLHEDSLYADLWKTILAGDVWHGEMINRRKDGTCYHEIQTITPVRDAAGDIRHFVTIKRDVSKRREAEERLRDSERLLDAFFSLSFDGFFIMTLDEPIEWRHETDKAAAIERFMREQHVTRVNQAMLDQYGTDEPTFMGRSLANFFKHDMESGRAVIRELIERGHLHVETEERRIDGSAIWVEGDYTLFKDDVGRILGHFGVQRDVTERRKMEDELARMATTDLLTGLPNRRHLMERLTQDFARFVRIGSIAAVLMLDLDHFKRINDSYGHAAGDAVLRAFSDVLRDSLRQTDTVGRIGGEEFVALLHGTGHSGAGVFAERLRAKVESMRVEHGGDTIKFTVSIGVSLFDRDDASVEITLARADAALYRAKSRGRNRVEIDGGIVPA